MRLHKAAATGRPPRLPRAPKLPRVHPPKLHQPTVHVTTMVAIAALVSAFAAAAPSLQGSFVGGHTAASPAAVVAQTGDGANTVAGSAGSPAGDGTFTTTVTPPPNTVIGTGPGNVQTVLFNNPNSSVALASPLASDGIPVIALEAYQDAANSANATDANCHIPWPLLAGIGRVESDHGRYGGAILRQDGTSTKPIIGIPLNGNGTEVVTDTDGGSVDGDPVYDRAVGPMQFIPSTWLIFGADGNGDGLKDPFNIFDAALAAANYLCTAGGDLSTTAGQTRAVLSYNHSTAYLNEVLALEHTYASGDPGLIIPAAPVVVPPVPTTKPGGAPTPPPVDPGPPLGLPTGDPGNNSGGGTGGGAGGSTHHPAPHPTSTRPHGGSSSTGTPGSGGSSSTGSTPADPSTSTQPTDNPTTGSGDPSDPGDPSGSGSTDPAGDPSSSDTPTCPASSSDSPTDGVPSSDQSSDAPTDAVPNLQADTAADSAADSTANSAAADRSPAGMSAAVQSANLPADAGSTDSPSDSTTSPAACG